MPSENLCRAHLPGMITFLHEKVVLFLDLARGKSALFSVSEPVLGAMLATGTIPSLRVCLLGLLAALAGYFCVYSLNDLLDLRADREEIRVSSPDPLAWKPEVAHMDVMTLRHPVAAGALPLWAAVTWVAVMGLIGLAAAYLLRPLCAWLFIGCAALEILYCSLRRRTWLKVIPAATMVAVGGLAGWFAVGEATWGALAFFFLLFGWEAGRNLTNDLADVVHDRLVGITTLASTHGAGGGGQGDPGGRRGDGGHRPCSAHFLDGAGPAGRGGAADDDDPVLRPQQEPRRAVGAALLQPADVLPAARRGLHDRRGDRDLLRRLVASAGLGGAPPPLRRARRLSWPVLSGRLPLPAAAAFHLDSVSSVRMAPGDRVLRDGLPGAVDATKAGPHHRS